MRIKMIILAIALIAIESVSPTRLFAQNTIKSLPECIQAAMDNNLTMKSGRIAIERAKDLQGTAFNIDKTGVSLNQDFTGGGNGNNLTFSQSFDFPTAYTSRRGLLKAETNLERSNYNVTQNELVKEISGTYYQLLYEKENIKVLQVQDSIYSKFLFLANAKLKSGETGRLEQMNAERLYSENKIELQNTEKSYQNIQILLQRWLNTDEIIEPAETQLPIMEAKVLLAEFDPEQTPLGEVYENKTKVSERNLSVTKQGYLPSFNAGYQTQMLIKGWNPNDVTREKFREGNFMGVELGVSVPLFFWEQKSKTKAARRDVEMAKVQKEEVMLTMRKNYDTYRNEYAKAKNALDYYSLHGNKQAGEIIRISQISYEKGEIGYIEYIQNLKIAVEIHLQYANAINDYNQTIIMLNYLQGNK